MLTALGDDRPGLVAEVTRYVLERGGNLEDSRMVNLRGQFAMMMLVARPGRGHRPHPRRHRGRCEREAGVHAELRLAGSGGQHRGRRMPYQPQHVGDGPPRSHASRWPSLLGELGVNIESVETALRPAPYTNAPLFEMELVVSVPAQTPVAELREAVGRLCDELNIDWQLTAL